LSDEDPTRSPNPTRYGAVWCDEHGKWECTRDKKQIRGGGRCHGPAITGLDVCRMHAGVRGDIAKAKGEAAITAWNALGKATVNPGEAVLAMLQMSWLRAHLYSTLLEYQVEEAQAGIEDERREEGAGPIGVGAGLVGHTYAAHPAIGVFRAGEAVRALVQLEAAERDRCVRFAKTAHDMGIAEREVRLAEQQGAILAGAIKQILERLELTDAQRELVPTVVPAVLRAIQAGAA